MLNEKDEADFDGIGGSLVPAVIKNEKNGGAPETITEQKESGQVELKYKSSKTFESRDSYTKAQLMTFDKYFDTKDSFFEQPMCQNISLGMTYKASKPP